MARISYNKYFDINEILKSIKSYLPNFNDKKFLEAFEFAEKAHRGQFRKDGVTPYIAHPIEAVKILTSLHADEETILSALLHDVPEDTEHDISEIKQFFGDKVAFLVDGITKLSKVHYQHDMPARQIESLKKLFLHCGEDLRVILVKLADRLHNMRTLQYVKEADKRMRISKETLEIYVPIANLLGIQDIKSQLEDLCFKNLFPSEYEKIRKKIEEGRPHRIEIAKKFMSVVETACKKIKIGVRLVKRTKNFYSIYKKISAIGKTADDIDDRIGIRIIVKTIPACYQVLGIIHSNFVPINDRFRDYIANPKTNGYQSLHTTVFGIDGVITDIQIRTEKMDFEAEYGIASNFFTEQEIGSDQKRSDWINKILEINKDQNEGEEFLQNLRLDVLQDRIFVFTPKGAPIDLPKSATAFDFAYAIHSDVGNHAFKADVNGKLKPMTTVLTTGDVVSIVVSRKIRPELSWLSLVKTNLAKNKILEYFKKGSKENRISEGHKMLQKEFDILGLGLCENINFKKLYSGLARDFGKNLKNLEDLFISIAEGDIKATDVAMLIKESSLFSRNKTAPSKGIKVSLKIVAKNRFGLLRDISEVLYKNVLDMYTIKCWAAKHEEAAYATSEILVKDMETLSRLFDELKQVESIISIYRVSTKWMIIFSVASFFTAALWVSHAFILKLISETSFIKTHPWLSNVITYFGFLLLIATVLYLTSAVKKYFPFVRYKRLLWTVSFSIPILATLLLFIELFYFDLEMSLLGILIEILFIYGYLVMSYINFRKITRQI